LSESAASVTVVFVISKLLVVAGAVEEVGIPTLHQGFPSEVEKSLLDFSTERHLPPANPPFPLESQAFRH
jgi:hypothetical protein